MKYEIMIRILFELLSKRSVSAKYLADKFEVSIRSIYRYMQDIEYAGVPLYTTRGNGGGFKIVDTYRISSTFMTMKEFSEVISALSAINDGVSNSVLDSALVKLKAVTKNEYGGFNIESGNLVIDGGSWGDTVGYKSKLKVLQTAIEGNKKLLLKYHDRNGAVTERTVEPHIILFKQGLWYVYAYCHLREEFRLFKTGRIESATILSETFTRRAIQDDEWLNFWKDNVVPAIDVCLEVLDNYKSDVEEWLGVENVSVENGKNVARAKLPFDQGLVSKIMGFGRGVKVVSPTVLKDEIKKNAEELINNYK